MIYPGTPGQIGQTRNSVFCIIPVICRLGVILADSGTACNELLQVNELLSLWQPRGVSRILINNLSIVNLAESAITNGHGLLTLAVTSGLVRFSKMVVSLILQLLNLL